MIFHASVRPLGPKTTFKYEDCGRYEKVDEYGSVELKSPTQSKISDTPELAASKQPAGALMAVTKNLLNDYGDPRETEITEQIHIYRIQTEPDIDCSLSTFGDFSVLEEVRVRDETKFPLTGERIGSFDIPKQLFIDVDLMYLPQMYLESTSVLDEWGCSVRKGIEQYIETGNYPTIEETYDVKRPDAEAYRERTQY
jgi:hypothetical protein